MGRGEQGGEPVELDCMAIIAVSGLVSPGRAGFAFLCRFLTPDLAHYKDIRHAVGFQSSTQQRMHLIAACSAIKAVLDFARQNPVRVRQLLIYTPSRRIIATAPKFDKDFERLKLTNAELWRRLRAAVVEARQENIIVRFVWRGNFSGNSLVTILSNTFSILKSDRAR